MPRRASFKKYVEKLGLVAPDLVEIGHPWALTFYRSSASPGAMSRPPIEVHELFVATRNLQIDRAAGFRRQRYQYRRGVVGFTPRGLGWEIGWYGKLEGFTFWLKESTIRRAMRRSRVMAPAGSTWRLAFADNAPAIAYLAMDIAEQASAGFPYGQDSTARLIESLHLLVAQRYLLPNDGSLQRTVGPERRINRARRFIDRNLTEAIHLEDICHASDLSAAQLNRLFRSEIGLSIWQYVSAARLERAKQEVLGTSRAMSDIATRCGFTTAAHFSDRFRKRFGVSPSMMRAQAFPDSK